MDPSSPPDDSSPVTPSFPSRKVLLAAIGIVLALSLLVRVWDIQRPHEYMFDEVYYAKDARTILYGDVSPSAASLRFEPGDEVSWAHPEMGKFAIALGILLFGDRSLGWRLPAAAAGVALLACVYPLARRLGLSRLWAFLALVFAATDLLGIAQSRIATLDIFVGLWTVLCIYLALRYADELKARWLLLAGLTGGLALATKWSGLLALIAAALVITVRRTSVYLAARRAAEASPPPVEGAGVAAQAAGWGTSSAAAVPSSGETMPSLTRALPHVLLGIVCMALLPAAIYLLSYAQYFAAGHTWSDFVELNHQMWHFNTTLSAPHSYASRAYTWIIDKRPVWYYFKNRHGIDSGVVAMGNPFLWWTTVAALIGVPLTCLWKRTSCGLLPLVLVLVLYLPWFGTERTSFLYYMTPVAPFMAILVAQWGDLLLGSPDSRRGVPWPAFSAWVAGFMTAAFAWNQLGRRGERVIRSLSGSLGWPGAIAVAVVVVALIVVAGVILERGRRGGGVASWLALAWTGAIAGIALAFLGAKLAATSLAGRLGWPGAIAVAVVLVALVVAGGVILERERRSSGLASWLAWAWTGAIAGIGLAFLPIVLADPTKWQLFYRLIWFRSWI
jgi:dolichyl-phosphate-mannose-protein mannosyltransferase